MELNGFKWHRRARTVMLQLTEEEQRHVLRGLAPLMGKSPEQWPAERVERKLGEPPLYFVTAEGGWRLFVETAEGREPEVVDVVRQEALDALAEAAARAGE